MQQNSRKLCRLCLNNDGTIRIFDNSEYSNHLDEKIMFCTRIKIYNNKEDRMPTSICSTCFKKLENSYYFRIQVEHCDYKLRREKLPIRKDVIDDDDTEVEEPTLNSPVIDPRLSPHSQSDRNIKEEYQNIVSEEHLIEDREEAAKIENYLYTEEDDAEEVVSDELGFVQSIKNDVADDKENLPVTTAEDVSDACYIESINDFHCSQENVPTHAFSTNDNVQIADAVCDIESIKPKPQNVVITLLPPDEIAESIEVEPFYKKDLFSDKTKDYVHVIKIYDENSKELLAEFDRLGTKKPHQCDTCGKTFNKSCQLVIHTRTHTGEKPYKCTICSKTFSVRHHLQAHQRIHTSEKPFQCLYCGKCFSEVSSLSRHTKIHTNDKKFMCSHCGKRFITPADVRKHIVRHTGEKPFKCNLCNKKYSDQSNLTKHNKKHKMERKM